MGGGQKWELPALAGERPPDIRVTGENTEEGC